MVFSFPAGFEWFVLVGGTTIVSGFALVLALIIASWARPGRWFGRYMMRYAAGPLVSLACSALGFAWSQWPAADQKGLDAASVPFAGISLGLGVAVALCFWWQGRRVLAQKRRFDAD